MSSSGVDAAHIVCLVGDSTETTATEPVPAVTEGPLPTSSTRFAL
jgi:hypothetical protein